MKFKIKILIFLILVSSSAMPKKTYAQRNKQLKIKYEETLKQLEFAQDAQASSNDPMAEDFLVSAEKSLRRARQQILNRRPLLANRSINEANNSIGQALKILFKEPLRQRRDKLEQLIQEAETLVKQSNNIEAQNTLERGLRHRTAAYQAFFENNFRKSLKQYNSAFYLIQKAIDIVKNSDTSTSQQAEDEAYRFQQFLSKNEQMLANSPNDAVQRNKQLALKQARKADEARQQGNFLAAIEHYHQATRLLLRALTIAQGNAEQSTVRAIDEISSLDELIDNIQDKIQFNDDNENLSLLFTRIKQFQENAHLALDKADYKQAQTHAQSARYLIERIIYKSKEKNLSSPENTALDLSRLDTQINEISSRVLNHPNPEVHVLLKFAAASKNRAAQALKNNNFRLAAELIRVSTFFTTTADDLAQFGPMEGMTKELISQKLKQLENDYSQTQSQMSAATPAIKFCLAQTEKMTNLARENLAKGFLNAADACIQIGTDYLNRCQRPPD